MMGKLYSVVLDCPDPDALAGFYQELLGLPRASTADNWVVIGGGDQPRIAFQRAPDLKPPQWPDPERPQQFHFDIAVDDVAAAEQEALTLGATRLPGEGADFKVFADPVGHPFCLVWDV